MPTQTYQLPDQPVLTAAPTSADMNKSKDDIFGGWVMGRMDLAGGIYAHQFAQSPVSTVAVKELQFLQPLFVGDEVSVFTEIISVGNTSITLQVDAYAVNAKQKTNKRHIASGIFIYVQWQNQGRSNQLGRKIGNYCGL